MIRFKNRGVIALLTVVILGSVMLTLGIAAALSGHVQVIIAGQSAIGNDTRELAATCLEEAVHRLKSNSSYAGGTVPLDADSCTVTVVGSGTGPGSTRTLTSVAVMEGFTKTLTATLTWRQNAAATTSGWAVTAWSELDPP